MRIRTLTALALLCPIGCTAVAATEGERPPPRIAGPNEVVILDTADERIAIDMHTGRALVRDAAAVPQGDRSALFSTAPGEDADTVLRTIDPATGEETAAVPLAGSLSIRAVSRDGAHVALTEAPPPGTDPWTPVPRSRTTIVVADPTGGTEPRRYRLDGNLEPEAFSNDGRDLFVIEYLPPEAPAEYRVAELELADGDVYPVIGRDKSWTRRMPGTRLEQLLAPDTRQLYTLYSSQPAAAADGYDAPQAKSDGPVAFVHVLNLRAGWAFCLPLPERLWDAPPGEQALAVTPDASRLFIVDPSRDTVAVVDARSTEVIETATVDLMTDDTAHAAATVSGGGETLFVGTADAVLALDARTLDLRFRWPTRGPVEALAPSADGSMLYAAFADRIEVLDPATGVVQASVPVDGTTAIVHVAPAA